jgi:hypothetical protein
MVTTIPASAVATRDLKIAVSDCRFFLFRLSLRPGGLAYG